MPKQRSTIEVSFSLVDVGIVVCCVDAECFYLVGWDRHTNEIRLVRDIKLCIDKVPIPDVVREAAVVNGFQRRAPLVCAT